MANDLIPNAVIANMRLNDLATSITSAQACLDAELNHLHETGDDNENKAGLICDLINALCDGVITHKCQTVAETVVRAKLLVSCPVLAEFMGRDPDAHVAAVLKTMAPA